MCGILGMASSTNAVSRDWLEQGLRVLRHRGPDDQGVWIAPDARVGFAHTRLSIVDLSTAGHQPMVDSSGKLVITFNGEIYNHVLLRRELEKSGAVFKSQSDTEVLLEAYKHWGKSCLDYLNGMYAFAIHDTVTGKVFCARDRAGEKPFFYTCAKGQFQFASEVKVILLYDGVRPLINKEALDTFLYMGYMPGESCLLKGVSKLLPGHALEYDSTTDQLSTWQYWAPEIDNTLGTSSNSPNAEALDSRLEQLLEEAIAKQLDADVPVGILLSGGVDSSLITALASRHHENVSTFTIRFPGAEKYDETAHARLIANHFKTNHVELEAEAATYELLPTLARQFDEPIIDSSLLPTYLVSNLVRSHCKVALGGDGGDELFGGYIHYSRLLRLARDFSWAPYEARRLFSNAALFLMPVGFMGKNLLTGMGTNFKNSLPMLANLFDKQSRSRLLPGFGLGHYAEAYYNQRIPKVADLLGRATLMDFSNYLPGDILAKVDRASMLNSLEIRAPFLDKDVMEMSFQCIPASLKASANDRKIILKKIAGRVLPAGFDLKRKQGFSIPLAQWLEEKSCLDFFKASLLATDCPFDKQFIQALFRGQEKGRYNAEKLFGLLMLELWRKEYSVSF